MPNRLGGKKFKRGKKFSKFDSKQTREMVYKGENQEYCICEQALGERRFKILCADGETRIAHIPGSFYKRVRFNVGDYALVSMRPFQLEKCDFCYKYNPSEVEQLRCENRLGRLKKDEDDVNEDSEFDDLIHGVADEKDDFFKKANSNEDDDFFKKADSNEDDDIFSTL